MIAWTDFEIGNHRARCPACGRSERDKALGLTIEADGKGVALFASGARSPRATAPRLAPASQRLPLPASRR